MGSGGGVPPFPGVCEGVAAKVPETGLPPYDRRFQNTSNLHAKNLRLSLVDMRGNAKSTPPESQATPQPEKRKSRLVTSTTVLSDSPTNSPMIRTCSTTTYLGDPSLSPKTPADLHHCHPYVPGPLQRSTDSCTCLA